MIQINLYFLLRQLPLKGQENGLFKKKMFNKMINTDVLIIFLCLISRFNVVQKNIREHFSKC